LHSRHPLSSSSFPAQGARSATTRRIGLHAARLRAWTSCLTLRLGERAQVDFLGEEDFGGFHLHDGSPIHHGPFFRGELQSLEVFVALEKDLRPMFLG